MVIPIVLIITSKNMTIGSRPHITDSVLFFIIPAYITKSIWYDYALRIFFTSKFYTDIIYPLYTTVIE